MSGGEGVGTMQTADIAQIAAGLTKALLASHSFTSSRDNRGVAYVQLYFSTAGEREAFLDAYIAAIQDNAREK